MKVRANPLAIYLCAFAGKPSRYQVLMVTQVSFFGGLEARGFL